MDKKTEFNNALTELVSFATSKGNKITIEDVKSHFNGLIDDASQYQLIYDYLSVNKIEIDGLEPSEKISLNPDTAILTYQNKLQEMKIKNQKKN